jgi:Rad3-related DNA helicase
MKKNLHLEDKNMEEFIKTPLEQPTAQPPAVRQTTQEHKPLQVRNVNQESEFTKNVEDAKVNILKESATDERFVNSLREQIKQATLKATELEREKQELEQQNVKYASELLQTQQELNKHNQTENTWENKKKARQYHYDGVKPIMEFIGIKTSMNVFLLYLLVAVLIVPFIASKLASGTFGALVTGGDAGKDRPKAVKGFLFTLFAVLCVILFVIGVYLLAKWIEPFGWVV